MTFLDSAYLIRKGQRLRVFTAKGVPDPEALATAKQVLPYLPGLEAPQVTRLSKVIGRIEKAIDLPVAKGTWAYGDLAEAGLLREVCGIRVLLDRPKGTVQTGIGADGEPWTREYRVDYGFLPDTISPDGEELDAYVGDYPNAPTAFLIVQLTIDGDFDEYKLMLGFPTLASAVDCYLQHMPAWGLGGITEVPVYFLTNLLAIEPGRVVNTLPTPAGFTAKSARFLAKERTGVVRKGAQFRKLPIVIEAFRVAEPMTVSTLEGEMRAEVGDWLVTGTLGEKYPVDPQAFRDTYEPVNPEAVALWTEAYESDGEAAVAAAAPDPIVAKRRALGSSARATMKAAADMTAWTPTPIENLPELAEHPVLTMPLTFTYDTPDEVGGWIGGIEPADASWLAFVDTEGNGYLWLKRDDDGGVVGTPVSFKRVDLIPVPGASSPSADAGVEASAGVAKAATSTLEVTASPDAIASIGRMLTGLAYYGAIGASGPVYFESDGLRRLSGFDGDGAAQIKAIRVDGVPLEETWTDPIPEALARPLTDEQRASYAKNAKSAPSINAAVVALNDAPFNRDASAALLLAAGMSGGEVATVLGALDLDPSLRSNALRRAAAFESIFRWDGKPKALRATGMKDHPVVTTAMSGLFSHPATSGGWSGWIEPEDQSWIAVVDGAGMTRFWPTREPGGAVVGPAYALKRVDLIAADASIAKTLYTMEIVYDADNAPVCKEVNGKRLVFGVALEPNPVNGTGDAQGHTYDEAFCEEACHFFAEFMIFNDQHGVVIPPSKARPVETYTVKNEEGELIGGTRRAKKGSWIIGAYIPDDELWAKVERGEWRAFSVEGHSKHVPL